MSRVHTLVVLSPGYGWLITDHGTQREPPDGCPVHRFYSNRMTLRAGTYEVLPSGEDSMKIREISTPAAVPEEAARAHLRGIAEEFGLITRSR